MRSSLYDAAHGRIRNSGNLGAWRLVDAYVVLEATGERRSLYGEAPRGVIMFAPNGRVIALLTGDGRKAGEAGAALHQSMMAYSGRFSMDAHKFAIRVDIAWDPSWVGTEQVRYYDLSGDTLTISSSPGEHPLFPGQIVVAHLRWTREGEEE